MLLGRLNAETSKNTNSRRDSFEHAWDCQRPGQSQVKSNASPMNHKCIMMGIFNRKVPNWVEVSIWSESIWYNHQFLDGWHWYALKIWLKNNKTPQASSCSACFMVPLRFWLWDPLLGICKSTSINHCGMLISWIFWIFLGIPHKPSLDTCQLQMPFGYHAKAVVQKKSRQTCTCELGDLSVKLKAHLEDVQKL